MTEERTPEDGETGGLRERLARQIAELAERHRIGPGKYCGLTPAEIDRAVIACHGGDPAPGEPVGFWPTVSEEARAARLREAFGPEADVERLRVAVQFFNTRVDEALAPDWALSAEDFGRAVAAGLARHYPELSDDARRVIAGNYAYSHAK